MNNEIVKYTMPWSIDVILITAVAGILMLFGLIFPFYIEGTTWLIKLSTVTIALVLLVCACYIPRSVEVGEGSVKLQKFVGNISIPVSEIQEIRTIAYRDISNSIRLFGSGGLFGYLGSFSNNALGKYTMYATDKNNLFLIRTADKTYVFSCNNSKELVELLQK
ncbi:MAG: PH domain-containing protein [Paludibacter sp.]|jgi:hypothetical protein|nr:PH domain-containing protein [Paludibacter sp.]